MTFCTRLTAPTTANGSMSWLIVTAWLVVLTGVGTSLAQRPRGIDVSAYQSEISQDGWNQIYDEAGKRFAMIRITHYGDGSGNPDTFGDENMARARAAGVLVAPYHYAIWSRTPQVEASYFLAHAAAYIGPGYLPPMLDLESKDNPGAPVGASSVCDWAQQWLNIIKAQTGVECGVYISGGYLNSYGKAPSGCIIGSTCTCSLRNYMLWDADWCGNNDCAASPCDNLDTANPEYGISFWPTWTFWQYCSKGAVPPISGNVDLDVFNGTLSDLRQLVVGHSDASIQAPTDMQARVSVGTGALQQTFVVRNSGGNTLTYAMIDNADWLSTNPSAGLSTGENDTITLTYATANLTVGTYSAKIRITDPTASNSPQLINVTLKVCRRGDFDCNGSIGAADVNLFIGCMTGPGNTQTDPACEQEDLDGDTDVDQVDFGSLQNCLASPDPACVP